MNIYTMPRVTTEDFRVANYLMENGCDFIGIDKLPVFKDDRCTVPMILRGEDAKGLVCRVESETLDPLTESEEDRLLSMLGLFTIDKRMEIEEGGDL